MRHTPRYIVEDPEFVRGLIRANPWATIVTNASTGLVASHYPVILDESASTGDSIVLLSHVGRPDDELLELGRHETLVIVQGPHGYVSPSVYETGENVPTWNHVTAHCYGVPEVLSEEENYRALERLTDYFEDHRGPAGRHLSNDEEGSRRAAKGTRGFRMRVTRFDARAKLSQNKPAEVVDRIIADEERHWPALARTMRDWYAEHPAHEVP